MRTIPIQDPGRGENPLTGGGGTMHFLALKVPELCTYTTLAILYVQLDADPLLWYNPHNPKVYLEPPDEWHRQGQLYPRRPRRPDPG